MIPYILSPMAAMSVQYLGTAIGLFPLCNNMAASMQHLHHTGSNKKGIDLRLGAYGGQLILIAFLVPHHLHLL